MPSDQDLLERIRHLEAENSELRDKLDMIYAIVAPEEESHNGDENDTGEDFVQITGVN